MNPTVTIVVSALNEEQNIASFISSALMQKQVGFKLENIWIFSDGSTDSTVDVVNSFNNKIIKVFTSIKSKGKAYQLNRAFGLLKSDILVQSDADIVFAHPHVLRDLLNPLNSSIDIMMVGGNPVPITATTFTEKAINLTTEAYRYAKDTYKKGNNIYTVSGTLLAFKKKFIKNIKLPKEVIAEDVYLYYSCLKKGFKYKYSRTAMIYYRSPQTLSDQIKQNTRFMASERLMNIYFPAELVKKESYLPQKPLVKKMLGIFLRHPLHSAYIYTVNKYCQYIGKKQKDLSSLSWQVTSTKNSITGS